MKTVTLTLVFLLVSLLSNAQETTGANIVVAINNITSNEGKVMVSLHTIDTFMKGPGIQNLESSIENGTVSFTFENVPQGTYAIMALHDANENQRMDFEENGMPKESFGLSGNDMSIGPPTFSTAKFEANGKDLEFEIRF
ncbi:hypothetical protein DKG77_09175 [Flagellimonas aquimarina]|uniref:DUF2141 domain-containing protein n=1 Tax=Flagellimonas aquimarina TaxID=2201895 RepID=A0A316KZD9_9FLAO|nr:DUF2141 domain-containing protein [Allomuricauda koreensis]PWL38428.1 hypothetical protein DKG77_09175 [Allomuricauda koreensis]